MNVPTIHTTDVLQRFGNINKVLPTQMQTAIDNEDNECLFRSFKTVPFMEMFSSWRRYNSDTDMETDFMEAIDQNDPMWQNFVNSNLTRWTDTAY